MRTFQPASGGVCGGLAEYFNTDATLIRVLFVVLTVLGGAGPLIYLAMWIIVPEES
jgi:phage shock protein C